MKKLSTEAVIIIVTFIILILFVTFKGSKAEVNTDGTASFHTWSFWGLDSKWQPMRARNGRWEIKFNNGQWGILEDPPDYPVQD